MGRQDNVEIFEDTQRLYSSNERLISAIKNSSAAQECFTGMGRYWYGPEHRVYQKTSADCDKPKAHAGGCSTLRICRKESVRSEFCIGYQPGRRCG